MPETHDFMPSTIDHLKRIAVMAFDRLSRHQTWRQPLFFFDAAGKRLHISPKPLSYTPLGSYPEDALTHMPRETRRIVFHDLVPMDTYLNDITGARLQMLHRRALMEIAKKIPSWRIKNLFYRRLMVGIPNWKTTIIAPNVFVDYIYPQLIESIGANTFIGEEAMILTHFAYPDRMEIGPVSIGSNCLIGIRSLIGPGVTIGDHATIGAYAVVTRDVPSGATLFGPKSG